MATLKIGILLASGARIGPRKAALLHSIRDTGSISAAARSMGMDYKRAWSLLDSMNRAFDMPVVVATLGGARGGGVQLTHFGTELLDRYRRLEAATTKLASEDLAAHALPESGPKI